MHDSRFIKSNPTLAHLRDRERDGRPVSVAVVGAGDYGRTLLTQLPHVPGLRATVVCDLDAEAARSVCEAMPLPAGERPRVISDLEELSRLEADVLVDCTGRPDVGARLARIAADAAADLVMVNVEADATIGPEAAALVEGAGGVYTLADGDQPSLILGLADWAMGLGFEVAACGKWTDSWSQPDAREVLEEWRRSGRRVHEGTVMYLDGTKAQMELASAANCLGFVPDTPGMHGPSLPLRSIAGRFRADGPGALFERTGVVDFANCRGLRPGECHPGGVFVVAYSENRTGMEAMSDKHCLVSDDRRHALFYRPYHLIGVETIASIVRAAIDRAPTAAPLAERSVEVAAVSRTALAAGSRLEGLGRDVRGVIVRYDEARARRLLPAGLARDARLTAGVDRDAWIRIDEVELSGTSGCLALRGDLEQEVTR